MMIRPTTKNRIYYYDALKGIAIIMVVCIHCVHWEFAGEGNLMKNLIIITCRNLLNCAVPLFFAISGYFMVNKINNDNYITALKKHLVRVYIPMLIWSLPFLLLDIKGKGFSILSIIKYFGCGYSVMYFVLVIMQFYILLPLINKYLANKKGVVFSLFISLMYVFFLEILFYKFNLKLPLTVYAGFFPLWLVFFVLGAYVKQYRAPIEFNKNFVLCLLLLCISVAESIYIMKYTGAFVGLGIKVSSSLFSFFLILACFSFKYKKDDINSIFRFLVKLGEYSFGIYLIHILVSILLNKVIGYHLFNAFIIILLCTLFIYITNRINGNLSKKYLGF